MDSSDLHLAIDYVGSCGIVLTPEQKATLNTTLTILRHENKFSYVSFWGIIRGINGDYFIAQGIGKDVLKEKTNLYRYIDSNLGNRFTLVKIAQYGGCYQYQGNKI